MKKKILKTTLLTILTLGIIFCCVASVKVYADDTIYYHLPVRSTNSQEEMYYYGASFNSYVTLIHEYLQNGLTDDLWDLYIDIDSPYYLGVGTGSEQFESLFKQSMPLYVDDFYPTLYEILQNDYYINLYVDSHQETHQQEVSGVQTSVTSDILDLYFVCMQSPVDFYNIYEDNGVQYLASSNSAGIYTNDDNYTRGFFFLGNCNYADNAFTFYSQLDVNVAAGVPYNLSNINPQPTTISEALNLSSVRFIIYHVAISEQLISEYVRELFVVKETEIAPVFRGKNLYDNNTATFFIPPDNYVFISYQVGNMVNVGTTGSQGWLGMSDQGFVQQYGNMIGEFKKYKYTLLANADAPAPSGSPQPTGSPTGSPDFIFPSPYPDYVPPENLAPNFGGINDVFTVFTHKYEIQFAPNIVFRVSPLYLVVACFIIAKLFEFLTGGHND